MKNENIDNDLITIALEDPNFSFIETFADADEPKKIKKEITRLLFLHKRTRNQLKTREREKVVIQTKYEKKKRDAYMKHSSAPNEKTRSILVEIDVEREKYELDIVDQQVKELVRDLNSIKTELDTLKAITYNLRTEMGAF